MKVGEAVFFSLAGEIAQVGAKVFDQGGDGAQAWIRILTSMDAEEIVGCFSSGFRDRAIGQRSPLFASILK